ncbi:MAG: hypothetical protein E7185_02755 [Erysipelotrichaceae bacterium]|nr:hypothetical protein [Erysipelotrichaceae bacterium]
MMEKNKPEAVNDELLKLISGGTVEETQELLDWCNRHGAGISRSADHEHIDASILTFLVNAYPELEPMNIYIQNEGPNYVSGRPHKVFMDFLRKKYGD